MKEQTFPSFLYYTDKVVVNKNLMPKEHMFTTSHFDGVRWNTDKYKQALAKWETQNIEAENGDQPVEKYHVFVQYSFGSSLKKFYDAQPCTCKMSGEKVVAVNLILKQNANRIY